MKISKRIQRYIEDHEVIMERVHDFAAVYCEIMKKDFGYGVEKIDFTGSAVEITIDQTCKSCYSSETLYFKHGWLEMEPEEFRATIQAIKDEQDAEHAKYQAKWEKQRIETLKAQLAELEARQK